MVEKKKRNYKKENERSLELNKKYCIALEKGIAKEFDTKLKEEKKIISRWFKENVIKYLEK